MTDYTVSARDRVLEEANTGDPLWEYYVVSIALGLPIPYDFDAFRNTRVEVIATGIHHFKQQHHHYYLREDLQTVFNRLANSQTNVILGLHGNTTPISSSDFLEQILNVYGVRLTTDDIVVEEVVNGGSYRYTLKAADFSYGWVGSIVVDYSAQSITSVGHEMLDGGNFELLDGGGFALLDSGAPGV